MNGNEAELATALAVRGGDERAERRLAGLPAVLGVRHATGRDGSGGATGLGSGGAMGGGGATGLSGGGAMGGGVTGLSGGGAMGGGATALGGGGAMGRGSAVGADVSTDAAAAAVESICR